jgi:hypothetical protein
LIDSINIITSKVTILPFLSVELEFAGDVDTKFILIKRKRKGLAKNQFRKIWER